jgi:hypothetical protein
VTTDLVPFTELDGLSAKLAVSGLFAGKTKEQIFSLLMLAHAEGVHPMTAMRDFDIIQGRPAKKAEAMHRSFLAAGGSVVWNKLDDSIADGTFTHPQGGSARIVWDMERVKKAEIKNEAMYKKYPRAMLRSRCISEGVRTVYPAATSGLYEPGEVKGMEPQPEKAVEGPVLAALEQVEAMRNALKECGVTEKSFLEEVNKRSEAPLHGIEELEANDVVGAIKWIRSQKKAAA